MLYDLTSLKEDDIFYCITVLSLQHQTGEKNAVHIIVPAKIYHSYQQDDQSLFSNILMPGGWIIFNIFIIILYHEFIPHWWQKNDSEEKQTEN